MEYAMARNTSVLLEEHFADFITDQVEAGHYDSASDVVQAGLRLLEEHEARVKTLQDALIAGEQSGEARSLDFDALKTKSRPRLASKEVAARMLALRKGNRLPDDTTILDMQTFGRA